MPRGVGIKLQILPSVGPKASASQVLFLELVLLRLLSRYSLLESRLHERINMVHMST